MKNHTRILLSLISIVFLLVPTSQFKPCCHNEWERGIDQTVLFPNPEIEQPTFMTVGDPHRIVETFVSFQSHFSKIPQVLLYFTKLELENGVPADFVARVVEVTDLGFRLQYESHFSNRRILVCKLHWMAINDPRIIIGQATFNQLDLFTERQENNDKVVRAVPLNCQRFFRNPQVAVFITGFHISKGEFDLNARVIAVRRDHFLVEFNHDRSMESQVDSVTISYIAGYRGALQTGFASRTAYGKELWLHPSGNFKKLLRGRRQTLYSDLSFQTRNFQEDPRTIHAYGISGFNQDSNYFLRIQLLSEKIIKLRTLYIQGRTWKNSRLIRLSTNFFFYNPHPQCAVLFSKCGFKGKFIHICENEPDLDLKNVRRSIRSIHVPLGRQLHLYGFENYQGEELIVRKSVPCIKCEKFHGIKSKTNCECQRTKWTRYQKRYWFLRPDSARFTRDDGFIHRVL